MNQTLFPSNIKVETIFKSPEQCAGSVKLTYVSDKDNGIKRVKRGRAFSYYFNNRKITTRKELNRFKRLAIPPAWTDVWICRSPNGHIQATGFDALHRKQYRYHPDWNSMRNLTKFSRLRLFGETLPRLRARIEQDIARTGLSKEKVLATVINLMEITYIRIGNPGYEKRYGSYGLTTLKDKHVNIKGDHVLFSFKGKKGILHTVDCKDRRLARIVKQCKEIPGKELFQYFDENNMTHTIRSEDVNSYLKEISGQDFTAKEFRTWAGSVHALVALQQCGAFTNPSQCQKNIISALDHVSARLGNTRTVCKKYYVHPLVFDLYESKELAASAKRFKPNRKSVLSAEEQLLLHLLKKAH